MDRQMGGQADASTEQWEWYLHSKKAGWLTRHMMPTYKVPLGQARAQQSWGQEGGRSRQTLLEQVSTQLPWDVTHFRGRAS